jgi:hypothetical protein
LVKESLVVIRPKRSFGQLKVFEVKELFSKSSLQGSKGQSPLAATYHRGLCPLHPHQKLFWKKVFGFQKTLNGRKLRFRQRIRITQQKGFPIPFGKEKLCFIRPKRSFGLLKVFEVKELFSKSSLRGSKGQSPLGGVLSGGGRAPWASFFPRAPPGQNAVFFAKPLDKRRVLVYNGSNKPL